jgi:hypothetical protein
MACATSSCGGAARDATHRGGARRPEFDAGYRLRRALDGNPIGRIVGGETGFRLSRDPDTVRGADIAFIRAERRPDGRLPRGYFEGAPDLAVELVSPGDTATEFDEKVRDWLGPALGRCGSRTRSARALWPTGRTSARVATARTTRSMAATRSQGSRAG